MRQYRNYRLSLIVAATMVAATAGTGCAARVGLYDSDHRDYHRWDDREDRAYRGYLSERHAEYRPIAELKVDDQRDYWRWRHEHPNG